VDISPLPLSLFLQVLDKYYVCNEKLGCDSAIKTKRVVLEVAPKLLGVHLKRYVQTKKGTAWVENKLGHHVAFPDVLRVPVVSRRAIPFLDPL
jgi:hypothetical protein